MQLSYGNYAFGVNQTLITVDIQTLINRGGQAYAQRKVYQVQGYLVADGQNAITAAENALKTALARPYQDLLFLHDDGSQSSEVLTNAGSITGVIVEDLQFPETRGPEYATLRSFSFRARAEYPLPGSLGYLLSFTEALTFWGGGPIYAHRLAINGPPQKQLVYPASIFSCTQQGSAVGYRLYPNPNPAKFPFALKEAGRFTQKSPERKGRGYQGFETTWEYRFESAAPLVGVPSLWIS